MLSSAVIVFREVFEIVLIVGIVLAATHDMPHRKKAIIFGFGGGILGAGLVALFTDRISGAAQGMGQEFFNAGILFTAAAFIGWTVLWMKRHAREIKSHFMKMGEEVSAGRLSYISLSIVIALAILREGSEIVLFSYGMLAAGQSVSALLMGGATGIVGGAFLGALVYMGLVRLSMRHFFAVTTWLLVFLVCGMISQGFGFLVAAGSFGNLSATMWDSSWLLSEQGIVGQSFGTLIGYTARPAVIQVMAYVATIGVMIFLMHMIDRGVTMKTLFGKGVFLVLAATALTLAPQAAHATKKVSSPYVSEGELEIEWRGGYEIDDNADDDGAWRQRVAVGYGVNSFWATEIKANMKRSGAEYADPIWTELAWENTFQLTEKGAYWLDAGLKLEYYHNIVGDADKVQAKLALAKSMDDFSHRANIFAETEIGSEAGDETEWGFSWSSRYRYNPLFEPGVEWYAGFEDWGNEGGFDEQDHRAGPVFYGKLGRMKYEAGYLFGVSDSAPDGTIKAIAEYEWYF